MALHDGLNNPNSLVQFGGRLDICIHCLKKLGKEKGIDAANRELLGALEGRRVLKLRWRGTEYVMCESCAKEALEELVQLKPEEQ